jgi:hypothetical protein
MQTLLFEGETCPDGVAVRNRRGINGESDYDVFRYRTARRIPVRAEISNLENPVVVAFINANTNEALQSFFARWGIGDYTAKTIEQILEIQNELKRLLVAMGGEDPYAAVHASGDAGSDPPILYVQLGLTETGAPKTLYKALGLRDLMLLECMMVAENGARYAECEHCKSAFLTGPLTWRRSHAKYCSDRCRVAAMRARNAKEEKNG